MKNILAFAGSNSSSSINHRLILYTTSLLKNQEVQVLKMTDYDFPMYSFDLEKEQGFSNSLIEFAKDIKNADGLIISVNEHNSYFSAYFKNLIDWLSRFDRAFLENAKVFLMSTSPGKRGGIGALEATKAVLPRFGATNIMDFSLPFFQQNFSDENMLTHAEYAQLHKEKLNKFLAGL